MLVQRSLLPQPLTHFVHRHQAVLAALIAIVFLMVLHQACARKVNYFDAAHYWSLAAPETIVTVSSYRGYVFPLLLSPVKWLSSLASDPLPLYRMGMSVVYGVLLTTVLPAAFQQAFGGKVSLLRRLVPVFLLALLFPGVLIYTLSDLPAVLLAFAALLCALKGLDPSASRTRALLMLASAGALVAAAYNTRTIYLFSGIPFGLLALLAVIGGKHQTALPRWLGLAAFAVGALAISLPQLAVNRMTHGINSMAVQSVINNHSLFANQLVWGLTLQRYETTVSPDTPSAVFYLDPAGVDLFEDIAGRGDLFSMRYYLAAVARHPLEFLALYTRHVINGLDVRDGLVYTQKPSPMRNRTAVLNFAVLAFAVLVAISVRRTQPAAPGFRPVPPSWPFSLLTLVLPVAAIIPGAIETRFFLPVHLLAYCFIAMHFDLAQVRARLRRSWLPVVTVLCLSAALFFAVSLNTMAHMEYGWPEIYRIGRAPPPG